MMPETWRAIPGYEGSYEVSNRGGVRSLDRVILNPLPTGAIRRQTVKGRALKPGVAKLGGYHYVNLCAAGESKQQSRHVHRLVMDAFVGPQPLGMQTRHLNGNPADNRLENLTYGTPAENGADTIRHGRSGANTTHCKRNHELAGDNLQAGAQGRRVCLACRRERHHERKAMSS